MFAAITKQLVSVPLCLSLWLSAAAWAQAGEQTPSLYELTRSAVELRHNLLSAREEFFRRNPDTLTIYVNTDNLSAALLKDVAITLDGKPIVQHRFNDDEYRALNGGAMKKIYAAPLEPGTHELKTAVNGSASSSAQMNTTLTLEKGTGHDTLKITIANPLQKQRPELFFEHQRGDAR